MSSNGGTAGQASETDYKRLMKEMELFGIAFSSLAIRSRCLDYIKPKEHCSAHVRSTLTTLVVEQKTEDGKTVGMYRAANGVLSESLAPRFCGKVNSWAPMFHTCLVSGGLSQDISRCAQGPTDSDLSTLDFAATAAVCPRWAGYRESSIGEVFVSPACGVGDAVMAGGGYNFVSPAIDWEGVCVRGECAVCLDGDRRCTTLAEAGVPQICLGGTWRALRGNGLQDTDLGTEQLVYNVAAQSEVATAVFAGLCMALLFINVSIGIVSMRKDDAERETKLFEKHLLNLGGGTQPHPDEESFKGASNRVSPDPHFRGTSSTRSKPTL
eukprot:CAMPEP_0173069722 /NCGR_PEP_ID=MMETSP1102-20130122/8185_1 /TAXON_ID=49646 /ORGANISM="Geminigera sp., Strain Caron Lab Isolate" /LENGTH=324 /DNA_ID=CAMNT_0013937843 /DNA_START=394 /DNA_END=1368 /DNA_ORIENTATION=+